MKYVGDHIVYPSKLKDGAGFRIELPEYHRAAVGLFPGTRVFLLHIPHTPDLIVTPIDPRGWGDLWRLEVGLKDTPGAARSIADTLVRNKINILVQEGVSDYGARHEPAHYVFMLLDLAEYSSDIDGTSQHRNTVERPAARPNGLITEILEGSREFLLANRAESNWDFSFQRMDFFYRHKEHRTLAEKTHLLSEKKSIVLPDHLVKTMVFGGSPPPRIACQILSDTEEKYIKIRFLKSGERHLLLRIAHRERIGAILAFMDTIKRSGANISNSYSRLAKSGKAAVWYACLELPQSFSGAALEVMANSIDSLRDVESFCVQSHYGFDFDPSEYLQGLELRHYEEIETLARISEAAPKPDLLPESAAEDPRRVERRLGLKPYYLGHDWQPEPKSVFVAMPFDGRYDELYEDHLKETIESCGLRAIRLDREGVPDTRVPLYSWIQRFLATSDFVLADVTGNNGNVLYEVGLAHAIGKQVVLICEEQYYEENGLLFDIHHYFHVFYSPFKMKSFTQRLQRQLRTMLAADRQLDPRLAGSEPAESTLNPDDRADGKGRRSSS